ncbi:hypothetical protein JD844_005750 [Phrynosoma platyrhinos]|uniref:Phospholipase A2 inhibitor n=1 Tax=Phrynosoma platyrhinos TaxID=52577 RepID=A0ABQ7TPL8_PHRPL|nr:hypothetical protein JD844_005750 [Phrynosoma platyrhinos]
MADGEQRSWESFGDLEAHVNIQHLAIVTNPFLFSSVDGKKTVITEKGCAHSDICAAPSIDLYLGHGRFYRGSLNCCTGDRCQNVIPKCRAFESTNSVHSETRIYGFSTIMQAFLRLLLFFVLLTTGASLHCEICLRSRNSTGSSNGSSITCKGPSQICAPNKDTCMITVAEHNLEGITEHIIEKSCAYSKICSVDKIHLFVGKGKTYRSSIICCKGHDCPKGPIPILPENTVPNGKVCPACFALAKTCKSETVKCTGNDTHCIDVTSTRKMTRSDFMSYRLDGEQFTGIVGSTNHPSSAPALDGNYMDSVIRGCTTKSLCASLKQEKIPLLMGEVEKIVCNPEVSRGSQPTCFLLLTFSGLLLMKIFE